MPSEQARYAYLEGDSLRLVSLGPAGCGYLDSSSASDCNLALILGVKVYETTYTGYYPLSGGETVNLGNLGDPNVSSLEMTVSTEEYEGYLLKSVVGYSAVNGTRIMGTDVGEVFEKDTPLTARFFGLEPADYSSDKIWYVFPFLSTIYWL